jgi:hypothetical protein
MSRSIDNYDRISIAEIVVYAFFLVIAIFLCFKHGMAKSDGWRFAIVLALARIIGSALRLASISDPQNTSLYIGWLTLNGLGLGPLVLLLLGLLIRLFDSINRQGHVVVKPLYQRLIQLLMVVGMILLIVGGTQSDYTLSGSNPSIHYPTTSVAGMAIFVVVFALTVLEAVVAFMNQGYVAQGEHRIFFAVFVSLPFLLVRLVYGCVIIFASVHASVWLYLGAGVIMEMVVVLVCEAVGLTLDAPPPKPKKEQGHRATGEA